MIKSGFSIEAVVRNSSTFLITDWALVKNILSPGNLPRENTGSGWGLLMVTLETLAWLSGWLGGVSWVKLG